MATCRSEIETIARKMGIRGDQLLVTEVNAAVQWRHPIPVAEDAGCDPRTKAERHAGVGIENALAQRNDADVIIVADGDTTWPHGQTLVPVIELIVDDPRASLPPAWNQVDPCRDAVRVGGDLTATWCMSVSHGSTRPARRGPGPRRRIRP